MKLVWHSRQFSNCYESDKKWAAGLKIVFTGIFQIDDN